MIGCRSCWGIITIRSGSTPRQHRPRSAASPGDIATVGSSCSNSFTTTSGHRRRNTSCTSRRSMSWRTPASTRCTSPPAMPAKQTSRHRLLRCASRSRTSRSPRRSHRTASGKLADESIRMMARLAVDATDHWHLPAPPLHRLRHERANVLPPWVASFVMAVHRRSQGSSCHR